MNRFGRQILKTVRKLGCRIIKIKIKGGKTLGNGKQF